MHTSNLSVVIPTYNRKDILSKCLNSIFNQSYPKINYEILIVDDGSNDGTEVMIKKEIKVSPAYLRYFRQSHKGPATARNMGIREAQGNLILFTGDDIIASPNLLAEHLAWHEKYPEENVAVLGYVTWSPEIEVTPFMQWLENGGPQFKYWSIKDSENVFWGNLVTANISFKRRFLLENGFFDEDFPYASYEDTEMGYRLNNRGLRIVYNDRAVGYHHHPTTLKDAMARMLLVTESRRIYQKKIGEGSLSNADSGGQLHRILSGFKFWLFRRIGCVSERRWIVPGVYSYLLDKVQSEMRNGCRVR